ncbi:MAG: hypothetical protein ACYSWO_29925 [Planctomycetota bacterium]|jgi:hypothetical protein
MSSSNILRLLRDALVLNGERLDLVSGDTVKLRPLVDDTGSVTIGDGTYDMDVKLFLGASSKYVLFDVGNSRVQFEDVDQLFGDNDVLIFGDGSDVTLKWDGTRLVGSAAANAMWDGCPSPMDPNYRSQVVEIFDDFTTFDATATAGNWLHHTAGGAGGTSALVNTVRGGQVVITCAATDDDDGNQISHVSAPFMLAAGKHLWWEAKVKVKSTAAGNALTESDFYWGLASLNEDLTAVADNLPADGIVFTKVDGDVGTIDFTASMGGTNTGASASIATLVEDTWMTLGFYVNGITNITPYIDGVAGTAITATLPTDTSQGIILGCRNGDATETITTTIDYVRCVQLR